MGSAGKLFVGGLRCAALASGPRRKGPGHHLEDPARHLCIPPPRAARSVTRGQALGAPGRLPVSSAPAAARHAIGPPPAGHAQRLRSTWLRSGMRKRGRAGDSTSNNFIRPDLAQREITIQTLLRAEHASCLEAQRGKHCGTYARFWRLLPPGGRNIWHGRISLLQLSAAAVAVIVAIASWWSSTLSRQVARYESSVVITAHAQCSVAVLVITVASKQESLRLPLSYARTFRASIPLLLA